MPQLKTCYRTPNGDCHIGGCPKGTYQHPETLICTILPPRSEAIQEIELLEEQPKLPEVEVAPRSPGPTEETIQPLPPTLPITGGSDNETSGGGFLVIVFFLVLLVYLVHQSIKNQIRK